MLDYCLLEACYILKENRGRVDLEEREAGGEMEEVEGDEAEVRMFCTREDSICIIYIHIYHIYDSVTHFFVSSSVDEHSLFLAIVKRYAEKT